MDALNSSANQANEGDQQPSDLRILSEKEKPQDTSNKVPPSPSPSQQGAGPRHALATEPFQPILKALADLERDDPKLTFPAARLVGLYRRLWESCVSKHIDGQKLEQENLVLEEAGTYLRRKRDGFQVRYDKQLSQLRYLKQAFELSQQRLVGVLDDWNHPSRLKLAGFLDNGRQE